MAHCLLKCSLLYNSFRLKPWAHGFFGWRPKVWWMLSRRSIYTLALGELPSENNALKLQKSNVRIQIIKKNTDQRKAMMKSQYCVPWVFLIPNLISVLRTGRHKGILSYTVHKNSLPAWIFWTDLSKWMSWFSCWGCHSCEAYICCQTYTNPAYCSFTLNLITNHVPSHTC